MKILMKNWNKYLLSEATDFMNTINTLVAKRENIDTIGMMTAENPQAQETSPKDNARLNADLEKELRGMNLGYRKIRGKFGNKENSFLIPNISKDEIIELGKKYNQESVIWGQKLDNKFVFEYIECATGETTNTRDVVLYDEDIQAREDFYSQSKKGPKKFVIPFFDDEYEMVSEHNLSNPKYDGLIVDQINERTKLLFEANRTAKSKWYNRGIIKDLRKKTWK